MTIEPHSYPVNGKTASDRTRLTMYCAWHPGVPCLEYGMYLDTGEKFCVHEVAGARVGTFAAGTYTSDQEGTDDGHK